MKRRIGWVVGILFVLAVLSFLIFYTAFHRTTIQTVNALTAQFGGVSLTLDLATTTATQERGLGGRTSIPSNYGMLFVFSKDDYYGFWMKDTLIPLDMFWLDDKGRVVSIQKDVQPYTYPAVFYPTEPSRSVLETNAGFADAHAIATGTPLLLPNWSSVLK